MTPTRLVTPTPADAQTVAGWSRSAEQADRWCSQPQHPFPGQAITTWWADPDVQPWLLVGTADGAPLAYGELWIEDEADEVELARLIVDDQRRRAGLGRRLVHELVSLARGTGRQACVLRVAPDNAAAAGLYVACGFTLVDSVRAAEWNRDQPRRYLWFEYTDFQTRTSAPTTT